MKSPAVLATLVRQLRGEGFSAARPGMIDLIANIGGPDEANTLFDLAIGVELKDPAAQRQLLEGLLHMARQRHLQPTNNPDRLKELLAHEDLSVRAAALRLAGGGSWNHCGRNSRGRPSRLPRRETCDRRQSMGSHGWGATRA